MEDLSVHTPYRTRQESTPPFRTPPTSPALHMTPLPPVMVERISRGPSLMLSHR